MKLAFLQEKLEEYDKKKSTFGRLFVPDSKGVKKLKEIAKNYDFYEETVRLYELINVLLADAKGSEGMLYESLRDDKEIFTYFKLMQSLNRKKLSNQQNFDNTYLAKLQEDPNNPGVIIKILKAWDLLSPDLQRQRNFNLLLQNSHYLENHLLTQKINNDHGLDTLFSECILNKYKKDFGANIVDGSPIDLNSSETKKHLIEAFFKNLPKEMQTKKNFQKLFTLRVIKEVANEASYVYLKIIKPTDISKNQELLDKILEISEKDHNLLNTINKIITNVPILQTLDNCNLLTNKKNAQAVEYLFSICNLPPGLKTQENFNRITNNSAAITHFLRFARETAYDIEYISNRMPEHLFTPEVFELLMAVTLAPEATRPAAFTRFQTLVNRILFQEAGPQLNFHNPAQSTHTASVHKSVSESAIKLKDRYGEMISTDKKLDEVIAKFSSFIKNIRLETLNKHEGDPKDAPKEPISSLMLESAKKAIKLLSAPTTAFVDKDSQVSTRQLLAFIWLGMHDDDARLGTVQDAYRKAITGLYDIQRGYNLDENFKEKDTRTADLTICTAGTFNKLVEILWGIHKDVELKYITLTNASLKMQMLVPNLVNFYLKDLLSTGTDKEREKAINELLSPIAADLYLKTIEKCTDQAAANQIVADVVRNGITPIWETIKPVIAEQIFDEFGMLYKLGKSDMNFSGLIENGNLAKLDMDSIAKLLPKEYLSEEKEQAPDEYNSKNVVSTTPTSRRTNSFFPQPRNQAVNEEKSQFDLQSLSNWQDNFKQVLVEKISSVENDEDRTLFTKLRILSRLLDQYPLDNIASVAQFERNLSNTVKSIENAGESGQQTLSSHYSDCLNTLKKSLDSISDIKRDMDANDSESIEADAESKRPSR